MVDCLGIEPSSEALQTPAMTTLAHSPNLLLLPVVAAAFGGACSGAGVSYFPFDLGFVDGIEFDGEFLGLCHTCVAPLTTHAWQTSLRHVRNS